MLSQLLFPIGLHDVTRNTFPVLFIDVEAADVRHSRYEGMAARALYVTVNVTLSLR